MDETNKMLSMLLVLGIVVSLIGLTTSLNKIGQLGLEGLTGMATDSDSSGVVQLNITADTNIAFTKATIDFGNGYVNLSCDNCTMWTNSSITSTNASHNNPECCALAWRTINATGSAQSGLWVQNQGNVNLTVQLNITGNASQFIGGGEGTGSNPFPLFQFIIRPDNESKSCAPAASCTGVTGDDTAKACNSGAGLNHTASWTNVATNVSYKLCEDYDLTSNGNEDEFVIDIKVLVPRTAPATQKTTTAILTATSQ